MELSTIFQLYFWRKSDYQEKTNDLPKFTDKHNVAYRAHLTMSEIRTNNFSGDKH